MAQFTRTNLTGQRAVIKGTDNNGGVGEVVVSTKEWDEVNSHVEYDQAAAVFDETVEAFFAPLTSAAEALAGIALVKPTDPDAHVVLHEPVEGVPAQPGVIVELSKDSIILRLVDAGTTDRLVWVGDDLEILEPSAVATGVFAGNDTGLGQE